MHFTLMEEYKTYNADRTSNWRANFNASHHQTECAGFTPEGSDQRFWQNMSPLNAVMWALLCSRDSQLAMHCAATCCGTDIEDWDKFLGTHIKSFLQLQRELHVPCQIWAGEMTRRCQLVASEWGSIDHGMHAALCRVETPEQPCNRRNCLYFHVYFEDQQEVDLTGLKWDDWHGKFYRTR